MYKASIDYHKRKDKAVGVLDILSRHFKAVFGASHDVTDDALRVMVTLKVDKRHRAGISLGYERLEELAVNVIEHQEKDDEYVIVTKDGERIKPFEIVLHSIVEIDGIGKSVDRDQAWEALLNYYEGWQKLASWSNRMRVLFILTCVLLSGAASYFGQPLVRDNSDAITIITTVITVFAGFLVAIMAILGPCDASQRLLAGCRDGTRESRRYDHSLHMVVLYIFDRYFPYVCRSPNS